VTRTAISQQTRALLRAHVEGDAGAFAVLVARHQERLWAIALRIMRNPDDAADGLQDAYIALRTMRSRETEHFPRTLIDGAGWARR
jgi:DNA-directed RNA polymerase specialized sigma24 family protein